MYAYVYMDIFICIHICTNIKSRHHSKTNNAPIYFIYCTFHCINILHIHVDYECILFLVVYVDSVGDTYVGNSVFITREISVDKISPT